MDHEIITITQKAQDEIIKLAQEKKEKFLRLGVKGGGCSGFSYSLAFDNQKNSDNIIEYPNFKVVMDPKSIIYLKGITLEYQSGLEGKGFIFINPNASNTCGCGESFSI